MTHADKVREELNQLKADFSRRDATAVWALNKIDQLQSEIDELVGALDKIATGITALEIKLPARSPAYIFEYLTHMKKIYTEVKAKHKEVSNG